MAFVLHRAFFALGLSRQNRQIAKRVPYHPLARLAAALGLAALATTAVHAVNPAWLAWADLPGPPWLLWSGIALAAAGFVLLHWAQRILGSNWSDQPVMLRDQRLVTSGPYRLVRHPIYTAFFMILGSTLLLSANLLVGGLWMLMLSLEVRWRIATEEALMREAFGSAYVEYVAGTGMLLPQLFHRKETP